MKMNREWWNKWLKYYTIRGSVLLANLIIFSVAFGATFIFEPYMGPVGDHDNTRVVVEVGDATDQITRYYNTSEEKSYCLYGDVTENTIVIKESWLADIKANGEGYVIADCEGPTIMEFSKLATDSSYQLIGRVHTHPEWSRSDLSKVDISTMTLRSYYYPVSGVAMDDHIDYFTPGSIDEPIQQVEVDDKWKRS